MQDLLFAPAWWMLLIAAVVTLALFWVANSRLDSKLRGVALGMLGVVILWGVVGYLVETPVEAARDGSKKFVQAAVARDAAGLKALLAPEATLGRLGRDQIAEVGIKDAEDWGLASALVTGSDVETRGSQVVANLRIFSQHEGGKLQGMSTIRSDWEFVWTKTPEGWRIAQITPTKVGETDVAGVMDKYFGGRGK